MDKVVTSAEHAVSDVPDGASIALGGFGLCGIPQVLIDALLAQGATDLETVSNNCGVDGIGLGVLLEAGRLRRHTGSYVGENQEYARRYLAGELEVEFTPQGTLAERLRPAGRASRRSTRRPASAPRWPTAACPGAMRPTARLPYSASPRRSASSKGTSYVLEHGIVTDFALVHAWKGDRHGNLVYRKTAPNFNPLCARPAGSPSPRSRSWSNRASSTRTRSTPPASLCSASCTRRARSSTSSGAPSRRAPHDAEPGRPRSAGCSRAARRPVRQPRHRHADAGVQLPARG